MNRAFVPLEASAGLIVDLLYIEGAIELCVDGPAILTTNEYDLVDELCAYLVDGVRKLRQLAPDNRAGYEHVLRQIAILKQLA